MLEHESFAKKQLDEWHEALKKVEIEEQDKEVE
jgi:hypothetical protein